MSRLAEAMMPDLFSVPPPPDPLADVPADVIALFETLSLDVARAGHPRYSSDAILHRIRWHFQIEQGRLDFKCNNNWTAPLARWFLARHPELPKFFETRERKAGS